MNTRPISAVVSIGVMVIMVGLGASVKSVHGAQSDLSRSHQRAVTDKRDDLSVNDTPATEGQKQRTARSAKNTRYNGGVCDLVAATPDRVCVNQTWPRGLPLIPVKESDIAVLGQVASMQPYLSTDRTQIYTEITVRVEEVFKAPSNFKLTRDKAIVIDQAGGSIKMPSGQVIHDGTRVDFLGRTLAGNRYVLFAKRIHHGKDLTLIRGYELRDGRVLKLSEDGSPGDVLVSSVPGTADAPSQEGEFLRSVRNTAIESKHGH